MQGKRIVPVVVFEDESYSLLNEFLLAERSFRRELLSLVNEVDLNMSQSESFSGNAFSLEIGASSSMSMYSALLVGPTPSGMAKDMTIRWCIPSSYLTGISVRRTALCRYLISSRCPMNFMGPYFANFTLTLKESPPHLITVY